MAENDQTHNTAITMTVETNAPLSTSIAKPEEVHERPVSASSSDLSHHVDLEKLQQPEADMPPAAPVMSEAESVYPPAAQMALVMMCICLTIFLVALVCNVPTRLSVH